MNIFNAIIEHINYIGAMALFIIGLFTVLTHNNLLKRVIGINIMETSVFLFFVSIGYIANRQAPIITPNVSVGYINPLPQALILTGIVVAVSITAYSLSLIVQLYKHHQTLDLEEILNQQSQEHSDE